MPRRIDYCDNGFNYQGESVDSVRELFAALETTEQDLSNTQDRVDDLEQLCKRLYEALKQVATGECDYPATVLANAKWELELAGVD